MDIWREEDLSSGVSSAPLVSCVTLDNSLNLSESMTDYPEYKGPSQNTMWGTRTWEVDGRKTHSAPRTTAKGAG